jgi:ribose 1,5-bisphosphokinase PhnN
MKPALLVVAGPNGAGKTTVTERLRANPGRDPRSYPFHVWSEPMPEFLLVLCV